MSLSAVMLSVMLSVSYTECRKSAHFAECRYAKCRYAECRGSHGKFLIGYELSALATKS